MIVFLPLLSGYSIADVAVTKRHQRLDEVLIFFARTSGGSAKLLQENSVRRMLYETHAHIYNKRMLIAEVCIKFGGRIAWQSFLVNNFADFPDVVRVKKSRFCWVKKV